MIVAIEHADSDQLAMALTLMVFVFNDALFTSFHVERDDNAVKYKLPLKLIDLFNFLFLVAALVVVNPGDNMFLSGGKQLPVVCAEWQFWTLLAVYWLLINIWTSLAGIYREKRYPGWLRMLSMLIIAALALTGLSSATSSTWVYAARWATLSFIFLYIAFIRPLALRSVPALGAPAAP